MLSKSKFVFSRAVQVTMIFTAMLVSTTVKSQINDTEGVWKGTISCGVLQVSSVRSTKAFVSPIEITVSLGSLTGKRENKEVSESFSGFVERSGHVNLEGSGSLKDDSTRVWRYRLNGMQTGSTIRLDGLMESGDRKVRLRTCELELSNPDIKHKILADSIRQENAKATVEKAASDIFTAKKIPSEKAASAKAAGDQAAADKTAGDKASAEKAAVAKAAGDKAYAEKVTSDKAEGDKAAADKAAVAKAAAEKAYEEKAASDKAAGDKAATDRASAEKAAVFKAAAEKATAEKAASDKAAAEKAGEQKAATEAKKAPIKVRSTMDL